MGRVRRILETCITIVILFSLSAGEKTGFAQSPVPEDTPPRQASLVVPFTEYEWWIIRWSNNQILCRVLIDHDGLPSGAEILTDCGKTVYDLWYATPACPVSEDPSAAAQGCSGVYLFYVTNRPAEKTILVDLPPPTVWVTLADCVPSVPENLCPSIPSLLLTGEEPLPNEGITAIHAVINNRKTTCQGSSCTVPLQPTTPQGITVEFWADTSYGDSSQVFSALVRVIDTGVSPDPKVGGWYVDVISSQWRGRLLATCAQAWVAFPPLGSTPDWLITPEVPELLASEEPYQFLAGRLIAQGLVDARDCPGGGLLSNGYADTCGLEKAMPQVLEWQNQFDERIIEVALQTGVPAQLMKNLFAKESQFWPGIFKSAEHMGIGQITSKGADALLMWNQGFFEQFCPLVLHNEVCERGYFRLSSQEQAILRGALAMEADGHCPDCPEGIDLTQTHFSVDLFAQTLVANCHQVGQIVHNATNQIAGRVSTYPDLWQLTLANYHAGPGCLSFAVHSTWAQREALTWGNVSENFTPACEGVVDYVNHISR
jgi:hypothetical protein